MAFLRRHAGYLFAVAALCAGGGLACSLNPQPLPPDNASDSGTPTTNPSGGTNPDAADQFAGDGGASGVDASAGLDAPAPPPGADASVDAVTTNDAESDAEPDAPPAEAGDAEPPDGGGD